MQSRGFLISTLTVYLALTSLTLSAYGDCNAQLAGADVITPIASWSRAEKNLALTVDQLFPANYLTDLRDSLGDVKLNVVYSSYNSDISIQVNAGNENVARFKMQETPGEPRVLSIENLTLQNPLSTRGKIHGSQYKKGLPPEVFNHAKHEIFEVAKAGGYTALRAPSSQNYMVNYLYRRSVGMKPVTTEAEAFQNYLDRIFKLARGLNGDAKITSLDQFSRATERVPFPIQQKWKTYLSTGTMPEELEVIEMDNQPAILIDHSLPAGAQTFFFRPAPDKNTLLVWVEHGHDPERVLQRDLQ